MPKMVMIKPNPAFKPGEQDKAAYEAIKKLGVKTVSYQTALQNVRNSKGMYAIEQAPANKPPEPAASLDLDSMKPEDLKVMLLSLGIKTQKQMKRSDVIALIRKKMDEVEIVEE